MNTLERNPLENMKGFVCFCSLVHTKQLIDFTTQETPAVIIYNSLDSEGKSRFGRDDL